jgi:hypothetical protein
LILTANHVAIVAIRLRLGRFKPMPRFFAAFFFQSHKFFSSPASFFLAAFEPAALVSAKVGNCLRDAPLQKLRSDSIEPSMTLVASFEAADVSFV